MFFIKVCILFLIFLVCLYSGKIISRKYSERVNELKDMKNALNMFLTKIRFTYESVPESFKEIGNNTNGNIGRIFIKSAEAMKERPAGEAWDLALDEQYNNLTREDTDVLKKLGRLLGKTDVEGQISEVKLVQDFLNTQIEEAETERQKNEKLYKTLGGVIGLTIAIILV